MANENSEYRVVVFGAGRVGKSSLVLRFLKDTFRESYVPTVEDFYCQNVEFLSYTLDDQLIPCNNNSVCNLQIVDTSGSYCFPAMQRLNISKGRAFIMVYSVTSRQSLEQLESTWKTIREIKGSLNNVPVMLVGNKCDEIGARELTVEEGKERARLWSSSFIETSAKANYNVKKLFQELLRLEKTRTLRIPQDFQGLRTANAKSWP
ncbi:GTP-binding protein Di-Ras2 [Daphnia magna]|uniref:GTP-binding protein Di-Ras2 n=1 Tax=Daphnia magna TaxID=35525 RepID=UPI0014030634|nr:GTP-binding protein Di-Ras2 [Daphnia magna]